MQTPHRSGEVSDRFLFSHHSVNLKKNNRFRDSPLWTDVDTEDSDDILYITGWWFQTFFIFHNIWDNPSH